MGALHILLPQTGFPRHLLSFGVCRISLVVCASLCAFSLLKRKRISKRSIFLLLPPPGNFFNSLILSGYTNFSLFKQVSSYICLSEFQVNVEIIAFVFKRRDERSPSRQISDKILQ